MPSLAPGRRGSILILLLLSILTIAVVIAFAFLRNMQMSRGITLVQRKDDLARLAAEMGMQHALAVCIDEYAMPDERRDDQTMTPVARPDAPSQVVFAALSRMSPTNPELRPPQPYDLAPDGAFNDLFNNFLEGSLHMSDGPGFQSGAASKSGYARWFEANRFTYAGGSTYVPATYDQYDADAAVPNPSVVTTRFPPVDPFVRGAALTKRHATDNPLLLDADLRPVLDIRDARYRLRYAIDVQDQSGNLWLNTEMPWIASANLANVRRGYAESIFAVGAHFSEERGHNFASIFLGYGAVGNSAFNNGLPKDWPTRGSQTMYFRTAAGNPWDRAFHSVHGNTFMTWNDPGGQWIGSAIGSYNDLGFALQGDDRHWHNAGEVVENQDRVRGDRLAQFMTTPFGRPHGAGTDHPWAINALTLPPRVLEALVAAYIPPAVRAVQVSHEICYPWVKKGDDPDGNPFYGWGDKVEWAIPVEAELTLPGVGPDLHTANFKPTAGIALPFASHPAPPKRDYWHTPTLNPTDPTQGRFSYEALPDERTNAERYPGPLFFTSATHEVADGNKAHARTQWRADPGLPRQAVTDGTSPAFPPKDGVDHLGRHIVFYQPDSFAYLSAAVNNNNWAPTIVPALPFSVANEGVGRDGRLTPYKGATIPIYVPNPPQVTALNEVYPHQIWTHADKITAAHTHPTLRRGGEPFVGAKAVTTVEGWKILRRSIETSGDAESWGQEAQAVYVNSYYNRLALACFQAIAVAQQANLAWASPMDSRSAVFANQDVKNIGIRYTTTPNGADNTFDHKGPGSWNPKAVDFATVEQLDRQFLANLGESFSQPGRVVPSVSSTERPPRYVIADNRQNQRFASPTSFRFSTHLSTAEYAVTNNIRTLLTPLNTLTGGTLTTASTDVQNEPPHKLWLLDEWNVGQLSGIDPNAYAPGSTLDPHPDNGAKYRPSHVARVRAMLMERVLNDWRLSFFGSEASYVGSFRPKDFDGDGIVWCSGYTGANPSPAPTASVLVPLFADRAKWGLPDCWRPADGAGDGPAVNTPFSVTGCFTINPSRQFKIHVRGELYDNFLDRAVAEQILQGALLVDPDGNVVRGPLATGLDDSTLILQRPIHNYYQGLRNRSYP